MKNDKRITCGARTISSQKDMKIHTNQKGLIFCMNVVQKYSSMQSLLLYLWIFSQDFAHISNNVLQEAANCFNQGISEAPNYFGTASLQNNTQLPKVT